MRPSLKNKQTNLKSTHAYSLIYILKFSARNKSDTVSRVNENRKHSQFFLTFFYTPFVQPVKILTNPSSNQFLTYFSFNFRLPCLLPLLPLPQTFIYFTDSNWDHHCKIPTRSHVLLLFKTFQVVFPCTIYLVRLRNLSIPLVLVCYLYNNRFCPLLCIYPFH